MTFWLHTVVKGSSEMKDILQSLAYLFIIPILHLCIAIYTHSQPSQLYILKNYRRVGRGMVSRSLQRFCTRILLTRCVAYVVTVRWSLICLDHVLGNDDGSEIAERVPCSCAVKILTIDWLITTHSLNLSVFSPQTSRPLKTTIPPPVMLNLNDIYHTE